MFYRTFLIILICLFPINTAIVFAQETPAKTILLSECSDEKLQISLLCNPDWELLTKDNVILIVVNEDPYVSITIAKSDVNVFAIEQLTEAMLKEIGQYRTGFAIQKTLVDQKPALRVDGISEESADMGLRDYYLIYNEYLYSILFAVQPNYYLLDYEKLFEEVIQSVHFQ